MRCSSILLPLLALSLPLYWQSASGQGCGPTNPNCVVPDRPPGDSSNSAANTRFVNSSGAGGRVISGAIDYTGKTVGENTAWIYQKAPIALTGVVGAPDPNDGNISPYHFWISDAADPVTGCGGVTNCGVIKAMSLNVGLAAGWTGTRFQLSSVANVGAAPGYDDTTSNSGVVALQGVIRATSAGGGTGGAFNIPNWRTSLFGINTNVQLASVNADNYYLINGYESDINMIAGSSAALKVGILSQLGPTDAVRGTFDDSAIQIGRIGGTGTWHYGLSFGGYGNPWAFANDSTLIIAQEHGTVGQTMQAKYGIDFSQAVFTQSGGAPLRMPLMTPASSVELCEIGAMRWDANFIYVCTTANNWKRAALAAF